MEEEEAAKLRIKAAAIKLQAAVRGRQARQKLRAEADAKELAATMLQARQRCAPPDVLRRLVENMPDGETCRKVAEAAAKTPGAKFNKATAFVVAGAGVVVAKHGNRNLSSKSGAADALTQMGLKVMVGPKVVEAALRDAGIGFMMAPMHHPAIAHVMPTRSELGTRTIFNILGPLTNPAGVKRQLTGAYRRDLIRPMAETLGALGSEKAWLVHGSDGTDELTITGTSWIAALNPDGTISEFEITPEDAGLPVHPFEDIVGGTPEENARDFNALLDGTPSAYRDAVLLNSAAALVVADAAPDLKAGVEMARHSIDSGAARDKITQVARITQTA